jgi:glc operon protein GlcG
MTPALRHATALAVLCIAATAAHAQTAAPAANPLDAIPEKMPFDVPYGAPISLERADAVLAAAVAEARGKGWKMICAVVDSGAHLVSFKRMDGAQLASIDIANHKARAAAKFRRETKLFESGIQGGLTYQITLDDVIGSRGGIPLVQGGSLVGAIGCSGGTGSQDEVTSKAGVAALR